MTGTTRRPRVAAALSGLAVLTLVALPAAATTVGVRVGSYYFEDARVGDSQVVATQGDRITFTFEGKAQHTATVDGLFSSGRKSPGQRYTTPLLTKVGTFTLYCQVHGARQHGTALIIRRRPSPSPSPTQARPSPAPSRTASPRASSAVPSPSPSVSPSPSPSVSSPRPSPTPLAQPSAASPSPSTSPSPVLAASLPPDVVPAGPLDGDGPSWLLPGTVLALMGLAGAGAIALGRRRRTR